MPGTCWVLGQMDEKDCHSVKAIDGNKVVEEVGD